MRLYFLIISILFNTYSFSYHHEELLNQAKLLNEQYKYLDTHTSLADSTDTLKEEFAKNLEEKLKKFFILEKIINDSNEIYSSIKLRIESIKLLKTHSRIILHSIIMLTATDVSFKKNIESKIYSTIKKYNLINIIGLEFPKDFLNTNLIKHKADKKIIISDYKYYLLIDVIDRSNNQVMYDSRYKSKVFQLLTQEDELILSRILSGRIKDSEKLRKIYFDIVISSYLKLSKELYKSSISSYQKRILLKVLFNKLTYDNSLSIQRDLKSSLNTRLKGSKYVITYGVNENLLSFKKCKFFFLGLLR